MSDATDTGLALAGKHVVVLGVADPSSLAWSIAKAFAAHGARVRIGYQQKFFSRVRLLLADQPSIEGMRCDVTKADELAAFFGRFEQDPVDVLVHGVAYGPPEFFNAPPSHVTSAGYALGLEISSHSLSTIVRHASPYLREWSSVMTLTFQASQRAMPMYGTMGIAKAALEATVRYLALELGPRRIRVNAISPGPVQTVAALGEILAFLKEPDAAHHQRGQLTRLAVEAARAELGPGEHEDITIATAAWRHVQDDFAWRSALPDVISQEDVAGSALFLGSDLSRKITGQVLHVDCGLSTALVL